MTAFHFGNVQWGGELPPHSFSKVGFHDIWISRVIEMMTPLNLFCFGDGGLIWTLIGKLVLICFSVQGVR